MVDRPAENLPTIRDILSRGHLRLVMFAVMLLAGILLLSSLLLMRGYVASNLELSARSIAYSVEPAVYFGDVEAVRETIGSVGASGSVRLIEVSGADGGLLATGAPAGAPADGSFQATVDRLVWPQAVVEPIRSSGEIVGHVRVYGSAAQFARFLISSLVIVLCCLGITIIATRALARRSSSLSRMSFMVATDPACGGPRPAGMVWERHSKTWAERHLWLDPSS